MSNLSSLYDTTFSVISEATTQDAGGAIIPGEVVASSGNLGKLDILSGNKVIQNEVGAVLANCLLICNEMTITKNNRIKITAYINSNLINKVLEIYNIDYSTLRGNNPHLEIYLNLTE